MPRDAILLRDASICRTIFCVTIVVDIASIRIKWQQSSKQTTMVMFLPGLDFLEATEQRWFVLSTISAVWELVPLLNMIILERIT